MMTTDCAKCGRAGGEVTINADGEWVDAQGVTWHEQANGDSWCRVCEDARKAKSEAAKIIGAIGGSRPKNFSVEEIAKRRERMRKVGLDHQAQRRALVASIVAGYNDTKAAAATATPATASEAQVSAVETQPQAQEGQPCNASTAAV